MGSPPTTAPTGHPRRPTTRLTAAILALGARVVPRIPPWLGYPLCVVLGATVGPRLPAWRHVRANLRVTMAEAHEHERERAARRVMIHYFKNYFDLLRFHTLSLAELRAMTAFVGGEHLRAALAQGRGVLLVAPHCGNYTIIASAALRHVEAEALLVVEQLPDPRLHRLMNQVRETPGLEIAPLGPTIGRTVLRALRHGKIVILGGDRAIAENALEVAVFGRPTPIPSGPATLALRTGAPLLTGFTQRLPNNRQVAYFAPPMQFTRSGNDEQDIRDATQKIAYSMEAYIRHDPSQWIVGEEVWPRA